MIRSLSIVTALSGFAGCSAESAFSSDSSPRMTSTASDTGLDGGVFSPVVRIDVYPTDDGADSASPALPDSVFATWTGGATVNVPIRLRAPTLQRGSVSGFRLNPTISRLPGHQVDVPGTVFIEGPGPLQSFAASMSADGVFGVWVLTDESYALSVVPDDPALPLYSQPIVVGGAAADLDLDIGLGVPIYGRATTRNSDGTLRPMEGAQIMVLNSAGVPSVTATTDVNGRYLIRVQENGQYTVECAAGPHTVPTWQRAGITATPVEGRKVDFPYPIDRVRLFADGSVASGSNAGQSLQSAVVRFHADRLDGFDGVLAEGDTLSFTALGTVDSENRFATRVLPGQYVVEVLPPSVAATPEEPDPPLGLSPRRVVVELPADLGQITLPPAVPLAVAVLDPAGQPVAGVGVECTEVAFGRRSTRAVTGDDGGFVLDLPQVQVSCVLTPPAERNDLALSRFGPFLPTSPPATMELGPGTQFEGVVRGPGGDPETEAWLEIRDTDDLLLAYGLTDAEGRYRLRAQVPTIDTP